MRWARAFIVSGGSWKRANLINQAEAGAGLENINSQLSQVTAGFNTPQTFNPLGDIFGDIAFSLAAGALQGNQQSQLNDQIRRLSGPSASGAGSTGGKVKVFNN